MSGHSRWSQIRHKKALTDKKKGQIFSRIAKIITIAARKGSDPKSNPSLSQAIEKARSVNMPRDNIERAIKKVSDRSQTQPEELTIEAIGPGNLPIRVKAVTDSRNRTIAEIKKIFSDHNAKMVQPGSISWMFSQPASEISQDIQTQVEALFEALDDHDDVEDVITST